MRTNAEVIKRKSNKNQKEIKIHCIVFGLYRTLHETENATESAITTNTEWSMNNFDIPTLYRNRVT